MASSMKSELEDDLRVVSGTYSVHVMLDKKKFKEEDKERLVGAIKDVVYAMRVQNIGHYPLEFEAHHARVSISRHRASEEERIKVAYGK